MSRVLDLQAWCRKFSGSRSVGARGLSAICQRVLGKPLDKARSCKLGSKAAHAGSSSTQHLTRYAS